MGAHRRVRRAVRRAAVFRGVTLGGTPVPRDSPTREGDWAAAIFYVCYLPLLWGPLLAGVTYAYHRRRRSAALTFKSRSGAARVGGRSVCRRWWGRWPAWSGYAAAGWSLLYGVLGLYWTAGGDGFPFAPIDQAHATGSILEDTRVEVGGPIMAALGLLGAVVALAMSRAAGFGRVSAPFVAAGWAMAAALTLVIPDYTLLAVVVFAPVLLVFAFTGVPGDQGGVGDILYWHRTNLILLFLGGLLWAATTLAYQRRTRAACPHCGRRHEVAEGGPSRQTLLRRGRWAVAAACLAPLPYEVTRVAWYLGHPLGISADFLRMMQDTPGMLRVGLGCAIASAVGGVLTHGLVSRWGEIYPRWIWFKAGKPVPLALAIVPASIISVILIPAGLMMLWTPQVRGSWALYVPSLLWVAWGAALGVATFTYYLRRRGPCRHCGQGDGAAREPSDDLQGDSARGGVVTMDR